jgi:hypothetical protein
MAFPTVVDADTKNGTVTSNATDWVMTYPTNLVSGDLILAFIGSDGNSVGPTAIPGGWVEKVRGGSNGANSLLTLAKISDGTETGNFTVTLSASEQGGWRVFRITGWFGGSLGTTQGNDADGFRMVATITGSPSANPDPPANNPANWDVEDTLWFAVCSLDTSRTISVYPLADRNTADVSGGSTGATLGVCSTTSTVASLDPGTFTISASDDWAAMTVAVRPAAAAAATELDPLVVSPLRGTRDLWWDQSRRF